MRAHDYGVTRFTRGNSRSTAPRMDTTKAVKLHPTVNVAAGNQADDGATNECADDAGCDVHDASLAVVAAGDDAGDPAGHRAEDNPRAAAEI